MAPPIKTRTILREGRRLASASKAMSSHPSSMQSVAHDKTLSFPDMPPPRTLPALSKSASNALSVLPLSNVVRSFFITSVSASPVLLHPSLKIMSYISNSNSRLNPERSKMMSALLKRTLYKQFCAGECEAEVKPTVAALKNMGLTGVVLNYAREVLIEKDADEASMEQSSKTDQSSSEIASWKSGTMATINMTSAGDFAAMKFTGAGGLAVKALKDGAAIPEEIKAATDAMCDLAVSRGVRLLIDAEQTMLQPTVDIWTLQYMQRYNKNNGRAVIYNTYQAYLKACPGVLSHQLAVARKENFTLGVKLVRGAYLGTDPRHLIHDTKADTDRFHDAMAQGIVTSTYNSILQPAKGESSNAFPSVNVMLAGHNIESIRKVQALRTAQIQRGEPRVELVYAQLQGMADEITCELIKASQDSSEERDMVDVPKSYKYISWGTVGECTNYLYRRGHENKDAVQRTRDTRNAMWAELTRRFRTGLGLSSMHTA